MYKIAAMGDKDSVLGFKALGLEVCPVESPEAGREALHRMAKENYAIIYMTEQLAAQLPQEIARYKDALTPAIILIPGQEGSSGRISCNRNAGRDDPGAPCAGADIIRLPRSIYVVGTHHDASAQKKKTDAS